MKQIYLLPESTSMRRQKKTEMKSVEVSDPAFFMLNVVKIFFPPDKTVDFGSGIKYPISRIILKPLSKQEKFDI